MIRFRCTGKLCWIRIKECIYYRCFLIRLTYYTLFFNIFADKYYLMDTSMEPLFWFVDNFTKRCGPLFVAVVVSLSLSVILIMYIIGLPYMIVKNIYYTAFLFVIGHWLLINVSFNYYMAAIVPPGSPPESGLLPEAVSICKRCITPKPPRTHHCSACNKCILKMDHHCPWLNNCIGYNNHRYFFFFCFYMWLGTVYVCISMFPLFSEQFWGTEPDVKDESRYKSYTLTAYNFEQEWMNWAGNTSLPSVPQQSFSNVTLPVKHSVSFYTTCVVYEFLLCSAVVIALGALTIWHASLIGRGETSIEVHINKAETNRLKALGKIYINPYNLGFVNNWKQFSGLTQGRTWRHILLPSTHKPDGNGLTWPTIFTIGRES